MRALSVGCILCTVLGLSGCGYSSLQQQDESVKTSWSEVVSQYQRRADLISSLAASVKGFAASEQELIGAAAAGARSGSMPAAPAALDDPAAFASYQAMQDRLTRSLRRLMGVSAAYPQLQSDANFHDLREQLAQTQRQIAAARNRYIEAAQTFNAMVRMFPTDLTARMFDFRPQPLLSEGEPMLSGGRSVLSVDKPMRSADKK
ncbi:MAG: LemA family protein [Steroidobacteraceae bacterium]